MAITYLLDVNVLVALLWRDHADHQTVARWFRMSVTSWATTPTTQTGFVRVLSLRSVSRGFVAPEDAMDLLRKNLETASNHHFWPADIEFVDPVRSTCNTLMGARQATDAYLVALAHRHGGKLATLDRGVAELVRAKPGQDAVELLAEPDAGVQ